MKRYIRNVLSGYCYRQPKRKKDVEDVMATSVELSSTSGEYKQRRDSVVSIVLAGGIVELYSGPVSAALVMERASWALPGPSGGLQPAAQSSSQPRERLFPGHKFYLVPHSTVKKLMRNAANKSRKSTRKEGKVEKATAIEARVVGGREEGAEGHRKSLLLWPRVSLFRKRSGQRSFVKRFEQEQKQKPIVKRPIAKPRMHHGLLLGWKPKLQTIKEHWSP